jgi:hypothetical protein
MNIKIYCEYDELILKELGLDLCEQCGITTEPVNIKDGICGECRAVNAGTHSRCKCGRIKPIQFSVCLSCKGYKHATV